MALSAGLTEAGFPPEKIETTAHVALRNVDGKATITRSHLVSKASVPGISVEKFQEIAQATKLGCPVSRALASCSMVASKGTDGRISTAAAGWACGCD